MAQATLRIDLADVTAVRIVPYSFSGKTGWLSMSVDNTMVFFGDYDADCVAVARALAEQLVKAADELGVLLAQQPLMPEPLQAEHQPHQSSVSSDAAVEKTGESPIPAPDTEPRKFSPAITQADIDEWKF